MLKINHLGLDKALTMDKDLAQAFARTSRPGRKFLSQLKGGIADTTLTDVQINNIRQRHKERRKQREKEQQAIAARQKK